MEKPSIFKTHNYWEPYMPEGAPYAGLRTENGETIAGTSSGLSLSDAEKICAWQKDSDSVDAMLTLLIRERRKVEKLEELLKDLK